MNDNNEAPVVMFTNYKRVDGFEVSLTLRGTDLKTVASNLDTAITAIKEKGGTPVSRQRQGYPPKPVEYVEGRACPKDGGKLIYATKKDGGKFIKCENNKWINGKAVGCDYIDWGKSELAKQVDNSFAGISPVVSKEEVAQFRQRDDEDRPLVDIEDINF